MTDFLDDPTWRERRIEEEYVVENKEDMQVALAALTIINTMTSVQQLFITRVLADRLVEVGNPVEVLFMGTPHLEREILRSAYKTPQERQAVIDRARRKW